MSANILKVLVSISKCHNTNDRKIDMTLKSSHTNTTSSTTTDTVKYKHVDTNDKD